LQPWVHQGPMQPRCTLAAFRPPGTRTRSSNA
jgi:hypothetical protein